MENIRSQISIARDAFQAKTGHKPTSLTLGYQQYKKLLAEIEPWARIIEIASIRDTNKYWGMTIWISMSKEKIEVS